MEKLKLIIAREYMSIVGRKSFIVMTLLIPVLMLVCMALPVGIAYLNDRGSDTKTVAVVDHSGRYAAALHSDDMYRFVTLAGDEKTSPREFYDNAGNNIEALVVIPTRVDSVCQVSVFSDNTISMALRQRIADALSDTLTHARVESYGVPDLQRMIDESSVTVDVKSVKWGDDGEEKEDEPLVALILGFILAFVIYMFVLLYGSMIMNGVIEEKTNRIVEVIVSSCKPFELMMGKITGVLLVGLTQVAIWVVIMGIASAVMGMFVPMALGGPGMPDAGAVAGVQAAAEATPDMDMSSLMAAVMGVNYVSILINFVLYFIGGYLLYASLFAAFGSAVDQASDASQFVTPIMMIMVVALYAGIACAENPSGPMAVWCSIIPFTSPVVMMVRLPYDVPLWQMVLSITLLFATSLLTVWIAARIYRTGILLYGKKHSLRDILRWIK